MELMERRRILLNTPHINIVTGLQFVTDMVAPIESLVINFSPIQDLHGYDSPWPAGGGVNLLPPHSLPSVTDHGITLTNNNGEYTLNGTTGSAVAVFDIRVSLPAGQYTVSVNNPTANSKVQIYGVDENVAVPMQVLCSTANTTATATFAAAVKIFRIRVLANGTVDNFKLSPVFSAGATAATQFYPYENICPISGWTGVNVSACGKNLFDPDVESNEWVSVNNAVGVATEAKSIRLNVSVGDVFTISNANNSDARNVLLLAFLDSSNNVLQRTTKASGDKYLTGTAPNGTKQLIAAFRDWSLVSNPQLELGSTATAYEPYQGTTYPISWQTEAGTVYGGNLDVTTGLLTVDRAMVDLGTLNWTYYSPYTMFLAAVADQSSSVDKSGVCSQYPRVDYYVNSTAWANNDKILTLKASDLNVRIKDTAYSNATDFKTAMSGVQLVYELATPQTYQLTPQQVLALKGTNNLLSNSNGGMTVNYWTHLD